MKLTTDLWSSIGFAVDAATDPATQSCMVNPDTACVFSVGDFVVFNDEARDANHARRRSYECVQLVGPGNTGDVVSHRLFCSSGLIGASPADDDAHRRRPGSDSEAQIPRWSESILIRL
jgi:hypothetical protein